MTTLSSPAAPIRLASACALLLAVSIVSHSEEQGFSEEESPPPTETAIEEAPLTPAQPPKPKSKPLVAPRRPGNESPQAKQTGPLAKPPQIHITGHNSPASQFSRIDKALLQGSTAVAIDGYESILKGAPNNTDALLGLALAHLRNGNIGAAEALIHKTLSISPRDSLALALLSPLRAMENPAREESRLQQALTDQPNAAPLHFALANLYARQNRWREAQKAYFEATIGDRDQPDYLFNLAISLERLNQPQAARQYYKAALAAADSRPAAFSRTLATQRISATEGSQP